MKRMLGLVLAAALLLAAAPMALAGESPLPFALTAPQNVSAAWLEGADSPTSVNLSYSLSNEITAFFKAKQQADESGTMESFMRQYSFDDIYLQAQIDWAVDDVNDPVSGWHYNQYWDGRSGVDPIYPGYDEEYNRRTSEWDVVDCGIGAIETVETIWVTRGVPNDDRWYGNTETKTPGVKDQLKPGQYTYDTAANDGGGELRIDLTKHTLYYRVRLNAVTYTEESGVTTYRASDWSSVAAVGKDAAQYEPIKPGDLPAPIISGLRMTDEKFNGYPVVAFTLTVPDNLSEMLTRASAIDGGIYVEIEGRFVGDKQWTQMQGDWVIKAGEMDVCLVSLADDSQIMPKEVDVEMRCRYYCIQPGRDDIYSPYSKAIGFNSDDFGHFMYGDVNNDERIDAKDALLALQKAVDKIDLNDREITAADVDASGKIDAKDALLILKRAVNKIKVFPVEQL